MLARVRARKQSMTRTYLHSYTRADSMPFSTQAAYLQYTKRASECINYFQASPDRGWAAYNLMRHFQRYYSTSTRKKKVASKKEREDYLTGLSAHYKQIDRSMPIKFAISLWLTWRQRN